MTTLARRRGINVHRPRHWGSEPLPPEFFGPTSYPRHPSYGLYPWEGNHRGHFAPAGLPPNRRLLEAQYGASEHRRDGRDGLLQPYSNLGVSTGDALIVILGIQIAELQEEKNVYRRELERTQRDKGRKRSTQERMDACDRQIREARDEKADLKEMRRRERERSRGEGNRGGRDEEARDEEARDRGERNRAGRRTRSTRRGGRDYSSDNDNGNFERRRRRHRRNKHVKLDDDTDSYDNDSYDSDVDVGHHRRRRAGRHGRGVEESKPRRRPRHARVEDVEDSLEDE